MKKRIPKWLFVATPLGFAAFIALGGWAVMLLWNWLAPALFGLRLVNFWQAVGLLALCRILFGGLGGYHRPNHRRRMRDRFEEMTPEERDRFREGMRSGVGGFESPAGER
jgi:ABC-type branched-subunit amino acid transport system permease subunit